MSLSIIAEDVRQSFNRRTIFSGLGFTVAASQALLIAGRNGSGKSTLVKILCGVLTPSAGRIAIHRGTPVGADEQRHLVGLVSPYLQLYEEFSALENLSLSLRLRGDRPDTTFHRALLTRVTLDPDRDDPVRGYSSGMKQRLKLALALAHRPEILVLDEPMTNLDGDGVEIVRSIMREHRERGILVVATNDLTDLMDPDVRVDLNVRH